MTTSLNFLASLDFHSALLLFWCVILFDIPRYFVSTMVLAFMPPDRLPSRRYSTSAVIAGHNESAAWRRCLESLQDIDQVIVVDDGSTDGSVAVIEELLSEGLIQEAIFLPIRSSKIEASNSGLKRATGEIVFIIDADTILDGQAVPNALKYFSDPTIGAVACNLEPANALATLTTRVQAIEYALAITAGKQMSDALGILANISGAFGAFRREALESVGYLDMEVAEDAALSMKLRRAGWKFRFAPDAIGRTIVPETMLGLMLQRVRWDSSLITIYWRKFCGMLSPFRGDFRLSNALTIIDVLWFNAVLPLATPIYIVWLYLRIGEFTWTVLLAIAITLAAMELIILLMVGVPGRLLPYIPLYSVIQNLVMRPVRILAIVAEMVFMISRHDDYIPYHQRCKLS
jgi:poly-beta-1,6-N-acetyl-D-glucosamine synthase